MEAGVALRALYTELQGKLEKHDNKWEDNCAKVIRHLWMTDCESLNLYVTNPSAAGCEDKRLEIDLEGLREYLWEYPDGTLKDYITEDQHDKIRWIDTSTMLCDPLTKAGPKGFADRLINSLTTGELSLDATVESQMKKLRQQKIRQDKALGKTASAEPKDETLEDSVDHEVDPE